VGVKTLGERLWIVAKLTGNSKSELQRGVLRERVGANVAESVNEVGRAMLDIFA
jgi:hypothetical protein